MEQQQQQFNQAVVMHQRGNLSEAIHLYETILTEAPDIEGCVARPTTVVRQSSRH